MRRRVMAATVIGVAAALVVGGAGPARALSTEERIAQHRAEIRAKIEARRAERTASTATERPARSPASPATRGPQAPGAGRVIEIDLGSQSLRAWQDGRVVLEAPVSTGAPGTETPTGRFRVLSKETRHWSTQFGVWMPWAMRVVGGIFIHELPVTTDGRRLGASSLGRPVSHGCIRVGVGAAERLFRWASVGTPVVIH
jgi:lipoprotein-anchoring transpeptidase ErfK/SrfK